MFSSSYLPLALFLFWHSPLASKCDHEQFCVFPWQPRIQLFFEPCESVKCVWSISATTIPFPPFPRWRVIFEGHFCANRPWIKNPAFNAPKRAHVTHVIWAHFRAVSVLMPLEWWVLWNYIDASRSYLVNHSVCIRGVFDDTCFLLVYG